MEETFKAVEIYKKLNKSILVEIEKILGNNPIGEIDYRDLKELPNRRNINLDVDFIKVDLTFLYLNFNFIFWIKNLGYLDF